MRVKHLLILVEILMISIIFLPGCLSTAAVPDQPHHDFQVHPVSQVSAQNGTWYMHIDPHPEISNTSLTLSGTTNIPGRISPLILLSSRKPDGTYGDPYGTISGSLPVTLVDGVGAWSTTYDTAWPGEIPVMADRYVIHVYDPEKNVYATVVVPSSLPSLPEPESSYWIRLNAVENGSLEEPFTLNGTTNLPEGYVLLVEVYPGAFSAQRFGYGDSYKPVSEDFVTVTKGRDGNHGFSVTANLSGKHDSMGRLLAQGQYFAEVHAINANSTVFDSLTFNLSKNAPWIHIDPIQEPVRGTNLTISGTTSLSPGQTLYLSIDTLIHPCPTYIPKPGDNTESICGGSSCRGVSLREPVMVQSDSGNTSVWKYETGTDNWCLNERYTVKVRVEALGSESEDSAYFNLRTS